MSTDSQTIGGASCFEAGEVRALREWKASGQPITLSVNGRLTFTIQDEASYERLVALVQWLANVEELRARLKDFADGKPGISLEEARSAIRSANGVPHATLGPCSAFPRCG